MFRPLHLAILVLNVLLDLLNTLRVALLPTLRDAYKSPRLLLHPRLVCSLIRQERRLIPQSKLSRTYMSYVWITWSPGTDENGRATKEELVKHARGVCLDIGAGHGSLARYLQGRKDVTAYVALEPNHLMHERLRMAANQAGFSEEKGTFLLIPVGLEDVEGIQSLLKSSGLSRSGQVDTAITVLALCSVPKPAEALKAFVANVLAPGGRLLWYEHVRNASRDVALLQAVISPIWGTLLDQCRVGQDTVAMIKQSDKWASVEHWGKIGPNVEPDSLFIHSAGAAVRAS